MSLLPLSQRQRKALVEHLHAQGLEPKRGDVVEVVAEAFAFLLTATVDQVAYGTGLSSSLVKRTLKTIRDQRPEQNV